MLVFKFQISYDYIYTSKLKIIIKKIDSNFVQMLMTALVWSNSKVNVSQFVKFNNSFICRYEIKLLCLLYKVVKNYTMIRVKSGIFLTATLLVKKR